MVMLVACTQTKVPLIHKYTETASLKGQLVLHQVIFIKPLYYKTNLVGTMNGIKEIKTHGQEKQSERF